MRAQKPLWVCCPVITRVCRWHVLKMRTLLAFLHWSHDPGSNPRQWFPQPGSIS